MEWFKLGLETLKVVYDAKRESEIAEANKERDKYKMQADNLASQLHNLKNERKNSGNGKQNENYRRNFHSFGHSQGSENHNNSWERKGNTKYSSQNQKDGRKQSVGRGGYGQNSSFAKQCSNTTHKNSGLSNGTEWKSKPNAANFGTSSRGGFQSTGRGRGRSKVKF